MKIHRKITLLYGIIIGVILLGVYAYLNYNLQKITLERIRSYLRKELFLSKVLVQTHINESNGDSYQLDSVADKISRILDLRVTLIDKTGKVLGDSELDGKRLYEVVNHLRRPEIQAAIKSGVGESRRFSTTVQKYFLYMATPYTRGSFNGFIRLSIPLSDIDIISGSLDKMIFICLIAAFILFVLASFVASLIISKPIRDISSFAQNVAQGDFSHKSFIFSNDEIGELAQIFNYMTEQIKQRISEVEVEKSKLEAVLMSMFEGVIVLDPQGKIILMNETLRDLLNIKGDPFGKYSLEIIRNMDIHEIIKEGMDLRKGVLTKEIVLLVPEEKIFIIHATPIKRKESSLGLVLVFHDITDLRRLEKIRRDFVANVSHELRTPMTSIKGYAETLLHGGLKDAKNAEDFVKIIYFDAERLARLIEDLLDLSKIESGAIALKVQNVDLQNVVQKVVDVLKKQIYSKKLNVQVDIPSDIPQVCVDSEKISQVFFNLIDNAIKYTDAKGTITISAKLQEDLVHIEVSDTGIGIPEEDMPRIFERFYRVDKARSREMGGTGLGLSIVKHILQLHQSQISLHSVPGKGTTFYFTLSV